MIRLDVLVWTKAAAISRHELGEYELKVYLLEPHIVK